MVKKRRTIAKKPTEQTADSWVTAGGVDPELKPDTQTSGHSNTQTSKGSDAQTSKSKRTSKATRKSKPDTQTSEHSNIQTSKSSGAQTAKSKRPDYIRTTIYIPKALHKRMKMAQLNKDMEQSEIAEVAIEAWLKASNI